MLEKASNAKKILMLFMSENAKNYAGLFYRWLPAVAQWALQLQNRCRVLDAKLSRGVRERATAKFEAQSFCKEAAKPSYGAVLVTITQRFDDVTCA